MHVSQTVVCIGTGPSLNLDQIQAARDKGYRLFGCNRVYEIVPDLEVLYGCNQAFWDTYWPQVSGHPCEKWTTNLQAAQQYGINWMGERFGLGLCTDPKVIHHGHGSGYSLVGMAHKLGAQRVLLLGYDLKYAPDYDGKKRKVGSGQRHYFGEYPAHLQHWPSQQVRSGVHVELVELYRSIHEQGLIEIVNCTPGSALEGVIPSASIASIGG